MPLAREIYAKMLYKKQTESQKEKLSHISFELNFGVACGLIDNALHITLQKCILPSLVLFIISIAIVIIIIIITITIFITVMTISTIIVFVKSAWRKC